MMHGQKNIKLHWMTETPLCKNMQLYYIYPNASQF